MEEADHAPSRVQVCASSCARTRDLVSGMLLLVHHAHIGCAEDRAGLCFSNQGNQLLFIASKVAGMGTNDAMSGNHSKARASQLHRLTFFFNLSANPRDFTFSHNRESFHSFHMRRSWKMTRNV